MKINCVLFVSLSLSFHCKSQRSFERFVKQFPLVDLPMDSVQLIRGNDTIDVQFFNDIIWRLQPKEVSDGKSRTTRPKVYKDGKLLDLESFGKSNERPVKYKTDGGAVGIFHSKVYPIARLDINSQFYLLIVKEFSSEISHYDLYSFNRDGIRLSAVPLFTYIHKRLFEDEIDYVVTRSSILRDGTIIWLENNRGLKTRREYRLRDDGYFEIVKEHQTGKFEY